MLVRYWQPWQDVDSLRRQLDQVFDDLARSTDSTLWTPAVELQDTGDQFVLKVQLPGVHAQDIDVQATRESVAIAASRQQEQRSENQGLLRSEFRYGTFRRVVPLPVAVQNDQVHADYQDGILTLTLPKVAEATKKVVKVNVGDATPQIADSQ